MHNVHIVSHPLLFHSLTVLRNKNTATAEFQRHAAIVSQLVLVEATRDLETHPVVIETPLAEMTGASINDSIVFVPVLRAGISMLITAREFLPWVPVGFIGLERSEQTAIAREYYRKFPDGLAGKKILVLDPMLATGGSLEDTIEALQREGAKDICAVCIVAAPEGIALLNNKYPNVRIYTGAVDSFLNEHKYIVPGLGDFGDRYFST